VSRLRNVSPLGWAIVAAGAVLGAVVGGLVLAGGESTESLDDARFFRGRTIAIEARIEPRIHAFGEPVTAELTTVFNRALIRAESVRAVVDFEPYEQIAATERTRVDEETLTRITFRYRLRCITRACLPGEPKRLIEWQPAGVAYTLIDPLQIGTRGPRSGGQAPPWPTLEIVSRLDPTATQDVRWRAETRTLPEPEYRVDATLATVGLLGGAGALAGVAVLLLLPLAPRRRGEALEEETAADVSPLERALLRLEGSRNGAAPDRRRALELVARELEAHGEHALAVEARRLAWSQGAPSEADAAAFAGSVRAAAAAAPPEEERA
jgi:hypothetical protein